MQLYDLVIMRGHQTDTLHSKLFEVIMIAPPKVLIRSIDSSHHLDWVSERQVIIIQKAQMEARLNFIDRQVDELTTRKERLLKAYAKRFITLTEDEDVLL